MKLAAVILLSAAAGVAEAFIGLKVVALNPSITASDDKWLTPYELKEGNNHILTTIDNESASQRFSTALPGGIVFQYYDGEGSILTMSPRFAKAKDSSLQALMFAEGTGIGESHYSNFAGSELSLAKLGVDKQLCLKVSGEEPTRWYSCNGDVRMRSGYPQGMDIIYRLTEGSDISRNMFLRAKCKEIKVCLGYSPRLGKIRSADQIREEIAATKQN